MAGTYCKQSFPGWHLVGNLMWRSGLPSQATASENARLGAVKMFAVFSGVTAK